MRLGHHFQGQKVKGQLAGGWGILSPTPAQLVKNCFVVAASYPFFVGIRGSVTHFFPEFG